MFKKSKVRELVNNVSKTQQKCRMSKEIYNIHRKWKRIKHMKMIEENKNNHMNESKSLTKVSEYKLKTTKSKNDTHNLGKFENQIESNN